MFYGRLFEIAPEVKPLFKGDMAEQGRKLMATLAVVVGSLHSLPTILPAVSTLAKKHVEYGVKPSHYAAVGAALLWTLERGLGDAWTPEVAEAWTNAYTTLSNFMIGEAYGRLRRRNRASCPATFHPSRNATSKASPRACRSRAPGAGSAAASPRAGSVRARCRAYRGAGPHGRRGGKLNDQEKFKREQHPFDAYRPPQGAGREQRIPPKPADNFRWHYYGLFYVAPAQNSYMCRLRMPNGILKHWQLSGLADLAERYGGGYSHVTTRANLQIREIEPKNAVALLEEIQDLGLCSRGSGADNIRNVTGTPTAGIDPQELIDTRPYAREWHFHILNERALYGLPRKFNVAFDGAGTIRGAGGHQRHRLPGGRGEGRLRRRARRLVPSRARRHHRAQGFRPRHRRDREARRRHQGRRRHRARVHRPRRPHQPQQGADEIRARRHGLRQIPRPGRGEARLRSSSASRPKRSRRGPVFDRARISACTSRSRTACTGSASCCRSASSPRRRCAGSPPIAQQMGDGDIRLTVWQNLLISGVPTCKLQLAEAAIEKLGLTTKASSIRAGLVACTGNTGCRFAASDTKRHAEEIARWCEARVELDGPVNIHLTGCHHSCAQHYIGDIGLLACKVQTSEDGDAIEGYHILVGGGFGPDAALARELYRDVKAEDAPRTIERMLKTYLARRASRDETFQAFTRRHEIPALTEMFAEAAP